VQTFAIILFIAKKLRKLFWQERTAALQGGGGGAGCEE
jgi:hypothetical protein